LLKTIFYLESNYQQQDIEIYHSNLNLRVIDGFLQKLYISKYKRKLINKLILHLDALSNSKPCLSYMEKINKKCLKIKSSSRKCVKHYYWKFQSFRQSAWRRTFSKDFRVVMSALNQLLIGLQDAHSYFQLICKTLPLYSF